MPSQSVIHLVMRDESESQSTAVYTGCRQYLGESTLHFDNPPSTTQPAPAQPPAPVPPNLRLDVTLASPIHTATAAAGDSITAKLQKPVLSGNEVVAPAGAIVQGRIAQMQHWIHWQAHYLISIRLEALLVRGVARPLYAIPVGDLHTIDRMATLTFWTNKRHYVVPAGYPLAWITVGPPKT